MTPNVSVGFNKQVTLEDGLYFKDSLQDYADVEKALSDVKQAQKVYTVKTGDTLWDIAHKNDLTFRELCALNTNFKGEPLNEKSNIREGDELIVTKEEAALEVRITRIETRRRRSPSPSKRPNPTNIRRAPPRCCRKARTVCAA